MHDRESSCPVAGTKKPAVMVSSSPAHRVLPPVARVFIAFAGVLMLGVVGAERTVQLLSPHVGALASFPVALLTFIVLAAVALVGLARVDARIATRQR